MRRSFLSLFGKSPAIPARNPQCRNRRSGTIAVLPPTMCITIFHASFFSFLFSWTEKRNPVLAIGFPETAVRFVFHPALTRPVDAQGRKLKKPVTQILSALRAFPCYFPLKEENPPTIKPLPACHAVPELPDNSAETTNSVLAELLQRCRPVHTVRRSKRQVFWLRDRHTVFVFPAHGMPVTC